MQIKRFKIIKRSSLLLVVLLLAVLCLVSPTGGLARAATTNGWQDTGFTLPANASTCIDATQPGNLLFTNKQVDSLGSVGTWAYNWTTKQTTQVSSLVFDLCSSETGELFRQDFTTHTITRFNRQVPQGQPTDHLPTVMAHDGSFMMYSLQPNQQNQYKGTSNLWVSTDGGLVWQQEGQQFNGNIVSVMPLTADARSLYAIEIANDHGHTGTYTYSLQYSSDGGATWSESLRADYLDSSYGCGVQLQPLSFAPATVIYYNVACGIGPHQMGVDSYLVNNNTSYKLQSDLHNELFYTNLGLLHLSDKSSIGGGFAFQYISNDNRIVNTIPLPYTPPKAYYESVSGNYYSNARLQQMVNIPSNLFLSNYDGSGDLWYSPNSGMDWQDLGSNKKTVLFTPYTPATILGFNNDGKLYSYALPNAGISTAHGFANLGLASSPYFDATQHNIYSGFKNYWTQNGGLAQFGYPKTEPFREINPSNGYAYVVQYFERNRFEYHPENKGTPYEVELGLLGDQLTANRRANNEAPFQTVGDPHSSDILYFAPTQHTLRLGFRQYWEQHGGLAIYGYPISEEFQEINPDDGKTYTVQYFERNRFEYHPENKGTPYEVLLGLLGNSLLRQKHWL